MLNSSQKRSFLYYDDYYGFIYFDRPAVVLEVGPGSGVVSTFFSKLLVEPAFVL